MSLNPRFVLGDLDLTEYPFGVEFGSDLGNAESVTDVLASLLADGEVESLSRRSNRTIALPVLIDGSDLADLATAEQALIAECDKQRNTLSVDPGDGYGPTTVYETFAADPSRVYDDDTETAGYRRWVLTIRALPYARSVDKIVDNAGTPPTGGGTMLLNCESTTGWASTATSPSGRASAEYVVDTSIFTEGAGSLRSKSQVRTYSGGNDVTFNVWDNVSGLSLSTGTGGYLSFAFRSQFEDVKIQRLNITTASGVQDISAQLMSVKRDANGFVRYVAPIAGGLTITAFDFWLTQHTDLPSLPNTAYFWYDDIELLPAATTDRQIVKQLDVKGSARTVGSLHIAAPTDVVSLKSVLAITMPTDSVPAGFQPDGRRWVTQGTTTTDSSAPEGSYFTPSTSSYATTTGYPTFNVPAAMLTPGPYAMVALVKAETTALSFGVQASLQVGTTTNLAAPSTAEMSAARLNLGWQFVVIGTVYLPPLPVQNPQSDTTVQLAFKGAKFSNVYMIPAWQVGGSSVADFSIVNCGANSVAMGFGSSHLWIDSPSTDQPQGGWWRGPTADRVSAQSAWPDAVKPGVHTFKPGPLTAFVVSTNAQGPTVALEYYPAWLGSAAL